MNIKKRISLFLIVILLVTIFTSCESESSGDVNTNSGLSQEEIQAIENEDKNHRKPIRPEIKEVEDVRVGIIDTDFKKEEFRKKLKDLYGDRIEIVENTFKEGNGSEHGVLITEVFFKQNDDLDNLKKIKVVAYTSGSLVKKKIKMEMKRR